MKNNVTTLAAALGAALLAASSLHAAAPTVTGINADGIVLGETAVLRASVADTDADLDYLTFQVSGPGISGWQTVGAVNVSGSASSAELVWTPTSAGIYTVNVIAHDLTGTGSAQNTFEVYTGRRLISHLTIANGVSRMFTEAGEILTKETSPTANVLSQNGGTMIFWSGGRITLKSGFHAQSGSFFWAAIDHDMDGYSDVEEATDTDGDGIPDAYEVDHGLNMLSAADAAQDRDGDGLTNLQEYQQGRNIDKADNPSVALVVFSPAI
jgi:hypothetical protein